MLGDDVVLTSQPRLVGLADGAGIYLACALLSFALFATRVGVQAAISAARVNALNPDSAAILRIRLFPEVMGSALLWVAMWYFWFGFDRSHFLKKAAWFLALFFFAPVGPALYYFFAFRRYAMQANTSGSLASSARF